MPVADQQNDLVRPLWLPRTQVRRQAAAQAQAKIEEEARRAPQYALKPLEETWGGATPVPLMVPPDGPQLVVGRGNKASGIDRHCTGCTILQFNTFC